MPAMANEVPELPEELRVSQADGLSLIPELVGREKVGGRKPQQAAFGCGCLVCEGPARKWQQALGYVGNGPKNA